ncbi:hypothetical protein P3W45_001678 [Vairimorpha bombi]|jgi:hypothetical protein
MNIYVTTLTKTVLTLIIQSLTLYSVEEYCKLDILLISLQVIYNTLIIGYTKYKNDIYRSRFLRKNYRPSMVFILSSLVLESVIVFIFYFKVQYYKTGIFNLFLILCSYVPGMVSTSGRKTTPLVSNEEFFKIAFLINNFIDKDRVIIKKGEVVQILDKKGEMIMVRNSEGQIFTIPSKLVNDDIDLVI